MGHNVFGKNRWEETEMKATRIAALFAVAALCFLTGNTYAADTDSEFLQLASDTTVSSGLVTLLDTTIDLSSGSKVLVVGDGRMFPAGGVPAGWLEIWVDNGWAGNPSRIEWEGSSSAGQHCFRCVGMPYVSAGEHRFRLRARWQAGSFKVGAGSCLAVMIDPAPQTDVDYTTSDSGTYDFTTVDYENGTTPPTELLMEVGGSNLSEAVVLAAGSTERDGDAGDAMWGLFCDDAFEGYLTANWTVNDMWDNAEWEAPMSNIGYFEDLGSSSHTFSLEASEFPWNGSEDSVEYVIRSHAFLLLLGGMDVSGKAVADEYDPESDDPYNQWDYQMIGTSYYSPPHPPTGSPNEMASTTVTIPQGHNGVVMFMANMRCQGDSSDGGGNILLWIDVDGNQRGSTGVQQLIYPYCVSQRTLTATYLSAENPLSVGNHTVKVYAQANGDFHYVSAHKEILLVYFD